MKRVPSIILVSLLLLGAQAYSQQGWKLDLAYKVAMPVGNLKDLVSKTSFNGWQGALMYGINNQVAVGFESGFQDFYQRYPRQVYHGAGTDISAVVTNSIQVIPLLLKGKYSFTPNGVVQPFAALGIGGSLAQYSKYYGEFSDSHSAFTFMAQPQVGIHIPVGRMKAAGVNVAAAYNYIPYKGLDADGLNHASIQAGVTIPLRQ